MKKLKNIRAIKFFLNDPRFGVINSFSLVVSSIDGRDTGILSAKVSEPMGVCERKVSKGFFLFSSSFFFLPESPVEVGHQKYFQERKGTTLETEKS